LAWTGRQLALAGSAQYSTAGVRPRWAVQVSTANRGASVRSRKLEPVLSNTSTTN